MCMYFMTGIRELKVQGYRLKEMNIIRTTIRMKDYMKLFREVTRGGISHLALY